MHNPYPPPPPFLTESSPSSSMRAPELPGPSRLRDAVYAGEAEQRRPWTTGGDRAAAAYSAYQESRRLPPRLDIERYESRPRTHEEYDPYGPSPTAANENASSSRDTMNDSPAQRPEWRRVWETSPRRRERSRSAGEMDRSTQRGRDERDRLSGGRHAMAPPPAPLRAWEARQEDMQENEPPLDDGESEGVDYRAVLRTYTQMLRLLPVVLHDRPDPITHEDLRELVSHAIRGYDLLSAPSSDAAHDEASPRSAAASAEEDELEDSAGEDVPEGGPRDCLGCGAKDTPEWRRGPLGPRTLCNACGLVFAKLVRKRNKLAKAREVALLNGEPSGSVGKGKGKAGKAVRAKASPEKKGAKR